MRELRGNGWVSGRLWYFDVFRGLLMVHMALDHASMYFNSRRWAHEFAWQAPPPPPDLWQFLTRFTGVAVAPGFCFVAGCMVALAEALKRRTQTADSSLTGRLLVRGVLLLVFDYLLISLPEPGFHFLFAVLSCLGICLIILSFLRFLPSPILWLLAFGIILLHPVLDIPFLDQDAKRIIYQAGFRKGFGVIYPILPWLGIMLVGYLVGRDIGNRRHSKNSWFWASLLCLAAFFGIRFFGGTYGNAFPHHGLGSLDFWVFAKYPPDLAWITWSFFQIFLLLAILKIAEAKGTLRVLTPFQTFGRCPFFFFVVHVLVLLAATKFFPKGSLLYTYGIWLLLLLLLYWPCSWYSRTKLERPNFITRYF